MTIIAVTLNESGAFTMVADKLVGSPNVLPSVGEN